MPTYVWHDGQIIDKKRRPADTQEARSDLPAPAVQSFETYASPIDDKPISSHRQRDKDMHSSGSYDVRDTPASFRRARDARRKSAKSARHSRAGLR